MGTSDLRSQILQCFAQISDKVVETYQQTRCDISAKSIPDGRLATKQRSWANPVVEREFAILLQRQVDDYSEARLLVAASKHSADWLHAIPITSCGLRLDDDAIRIAVGLRLGADVCQPHTCCCGVQVDVKESHALSRKRNSGQIIRLNHLNEITHRSLNRTGILTTRESQELLRVDGKRPDGHTLIPRWEGRCLRWDVTVADTTAASYLAATATVAGSVAESTAVSKEMKYLKLSNTYHFFPIAIESHGPLSNNASSFLSDLDRRITISPPDARETSFLF